MQNNTINTETRKILMDIITDYHGKLTLQVDDTNIEVTRHFVDNCTADQLINTYMYLQSGKQLRLLYHDNGTYMAQSFACVVGIEPDGYIHS